MSSATNGKTKDFASSSPFPIVVLSLEGSSRVQSLVKELERVDLISKCTIVENKRDAEDGVRGCFLAHQNAIADALDANPSALGVIVFEDDVRFSNETKGIPASISCATAALDDLDLDVVGLGGAPIGPLRRRNRPRGNQTVYEGRFHCAHAYAIRASAARVLLEVKFKCHGRALRRGDHYDQVLADMCSMGLLVPCIAFQARSEDLTTTNSSSALYRSLTKARDLIGMRNFQKTAVCFFLALGWCIDLACCWKCVCRPKQLPSRAKKYRTVPEMRSA